MKKVFLTMLIAAILLSCTKTSTKNNGASHTTQASAADSTVNSDNGEATALLAFIAGDVVKLSQKNPTPQVVTVGSINGEEVTLDQFNEFREQCEKYIYLTATRVPQEEYIIKRAWDELVRNRFLTAQAGISKDELNNKILNTNWAEWNKEIDELEKFGDLTTAVGMVRMPRILVAEDGKFNNEAFNHFADFIEEAYGQELDAETANYLKNCYDVIAAWDFFKIALTNKLIEDKLQASHPEELNKIKELCNATDKSYDVVYHTWEVAPGETELNKVESTFNEYAEDLKKENADLNKIAYSAKSYYSGLLLTGEAFGDYLEDVKTCAKGEVKVLGANKKDNTYALVHTVRKERIPETIKYRYIAIQHNSADTVTATTEKIFAQLNSNAVEFDSIAKNYPAFTVEFNTNNLSDQYNIAASTPEIQNEIYNAETGVYKIVEVNPNVKFIVQVMEKNGEVEAYDALVIVDKIPINNDTYKERYNEINKLIASYKNVEDFETQTTATNIKVDANSANIDGIPGSRELLKWVLRGDNNGKISKIISYNVGNKKYLMVVGVKGSTTSEKGTSVVNRVYEHM